MLFSHLQILLPIFVLFLFIFCFIFCFIFYLFIFLFILRFLSLFFPLSSISFFTLSSLHFSLSLSLSLPFQQTNKQTPSLDIRTGAKKTAIIEGESPSCLIEVKCTKKENNLSTIFIVLVGNNAIRERKSDSFFFGGGEVWRRER